MDKLVIVVGAGALGSHVVQFLRTTEAMITVIDFDRIEQKNTLSQFHPKSGVGKSKVVSLQQTMQFLWGTKIGIIPHKVVADNARGLLSKASLAIDCLDNGASRRLVQNTIRELKVPCLHGALAADGGFGRVVWDESFKVDDEAGAGQATCEGGEHLPFIGIVSAFIARAAQEFLKVGKKSGYEVHPGGVIKT